MRTHLILTVLVLLCTSTVFSQRILWEKHFPTRIKSERITSVFPAADGAYIYAGTRTGDIPNSSAASAYYGKISRAGDTLWNKSLNIYTEGVQATAYDDTSFYLLVRSRFEVVIPPLAYQYFPTYLYQIDTSGNILKRSLLNPSFEKLGLFYLYKASNGDLVASGYTSRSILGSGQCDWTVMRIAPDGTVKWHRFYNPGVAFACGCNASQDWNHKILLSGIKNSSLAVLSIDSNGTPLDTFRTLITNPRGVPLTWSSATRHPDGGILATGNLPEVSNVLQRQAFILKTGSNDGSDFRFIFDSSGNSSIKPIVNGDGSIVVYNARIQPFTAFLTKYNSLGNIIWQLPLSSVPDESADIEGMAYVSDTSAIMVGSWYDSRGAARQNYYDAYFVRISGIGTPFDPVSTPKGRGQQFVAFPNPATDHITVQVNGASESASVQLYDAQGRLLEQHYTSASETGQQLTLQTSALPSGVYHLKTVLAGSVQTSRFVKH